MPILRTESKNDQNGALWNGTPDIFKTDMDVDLLSLSSVKGITIEDGGHLISITIELTDPSDPTWTSLPISVPVFHHDLAMFVISPSNKIPGRRIAILNCQYRVDAQTHPNEVPLQKLPKKGIILSASVTANLNIETGIINVSGEVLVEPKRSKLKAKIVAYSVILPFKKIKKKA